MKFHEFHGPKIPKAKNREELERWIHKHQQIIVKDSTLAANDKRVRIAFDTSMFYWKFDDRPYFSIYPKIVDALLKTKLDVTVDSLHFPTTSDNLLIRFAKGYELDGIIETLFVAVGVSGEEKDPNFGEKAAIHIVATRTDGNLELLVCVTDRNTHLQQLMDENAKEPSHIDPGVQVDPISMDKQWKHHMVQAFKIALGICLLDPDPDLIVPDILESDRSKLDETIDPERMLQLAEKAKRRGKFGWIVGECTDEKEGAEVSAHYRRGHWGFRWAGVGKCRLKWTKIKSSIIHRDKITRVPTGYLDKELNDGK